MVRNYLNLHVEFKPGADRAIPVVIQSGHGVVKATIRLPMDDRLYQEMVQWNTLPADQATLERIGRMLFDALFHGDALELYQRSRDGFDHERLRLTLDVTHADPTIVALPWEYLHEPERGSLALMDVPIVRYVHAKRPAPGIMPARLKVLLTSAHTPPAVDFTPQLEQVRQAFDARGLACTVDPHLTYSRLQQHLQEEYHIWHFVGHGWQRDGIGALLLEDGHDDAWPVPAPELAALLAGSGLRMVVLNACNSGRVEGDPSHSLALSLVRSGVPAVVAMQSEVTEEAARRFAEGFYGALVRGWPADACVGEGRRLILGLASPADWGIPVVYTLDAQAEVLHLPYIECGETRVSSDPRGGAVLDPGRREPLPRRFVPQPRPFPPGLRGRDDEIKHLSDDIGYGKARWLRADGGAGSTWLLQAAAVRTTTRMQGVAYLSGADEPTHKDEIVQRLFRRFYAQDASTGVDPGQAVNCLEKLRALFVLDRLQLSPGDLIDLRNMLGSGAVFIASEGTAPDGIGQYDLAGLPRDAAKDLFEEAASARPVGLHGASGSAAQSPTMTTRDQQAVDRICAALEDLPLPVRLAGRLMRSKRVSLFRLAGQLRTRVLLRRLAARLAQSEHILRRPLARRAAQAANRLRPLACIVGLIVGTLDRNETAALAAVVRAGGPHADLAAITAVSGLAEPQAVAALDALAGLGLVLHNAAIYEVPSPSLRRELDRRLRRGDERRRAAAYYAGLARSHRGDMPWLEEHRPHLVEAMRALRDTNPAEACAVGQILQPLLVVHGLWQSWDEVIDTVAQSAVRVRDAGLRDELRAWAHHERGTRAALRRDRQTALAHLERAIELRKHDLDAAVVSKHNLDYLKRLLPPPAIPHVPDNASDPGTRQGEPPPIGTWVRRTTAVGLRSLPVLLLPVLVWLVAQVIRSDPPSTPAPTVVSTIVTTAATSPPRASPTIAVPAVASPERESAQCEVMAEAGLNVRSGPATSYPTVRPAIPRDTPLTPIGRNPDGSWLLVRVEGGAEGWVRADLTSCAALVEPLPTVTAPPPPEPTPTYTATAIPPPIVAVTAAPPGAPPAEIPAPVPPPVITPTPQPSGPHLGFWSGTTEQGLPIVFTVTSDDPFGPDSPFVTDESVVELSVTFRFPEPCPIGEVTFRSLGSAFVFPPPDEAFHFLNLETDVAGADLDGAFRSPTEVQGTLAVSDRREIGAQFRQHCPLRTLITWSATKQR